MYKLYYLPYREKKKLDYITLIWLYDIAFVENQIDDTKVYYKDYKIPNIRSKIEFYSYQDLAN